MMNIENISISHLCGKLTFSTKSLINDSHILPKFTVLQGAGKTAKESVVLEEDQVSTTHHHSWSLQVDSDVSSVGALGFWPCGYFTNLLFMPRDSNQGVDIDWFIYFS